VRFPRKQLIFVAAFALAVSACGRPKTFDVSKPRPPVERETPTVNRPQGFVNVTAAAARAIETRQNEQVMFLVAGANQAKNNPPSPGASPDNPTSVAPATSSGCGGDLPPCYVKQRESGGNYGAYNPTGCGGAGCYGAWQFSGEWAGKLGLPSDLSQATPAQQDEAARQLWNGGAGCSNWGAC